ncbi:MAG: hypothetical protein GX256_02020 [Fretibacterium sp.]|nr:hypothetical protein [Fretibacterium sp.]
MKFVLNESALLERLHCEPDSDTFARALELADSVKDLIHPGFAVKKLALDGVDEKGVRVGDIFFESRIVAKKLKGESSVFAYVATCGRELSDRIEGTEDLPDRHLLGEIAYQAYLSVMEVMTLDVERTFGIERKIYLRPGSIRDWKVTEIRKIFTLLGRLCDDLDVRVLDNGMIVPLKSTSGIFYASDEEFSSCALCPRAHCELRTMPFDEELHSEMHRH